MDCCKNHSAHGKEGAPTQHEEAGKEVASPERNTVSYFLILGAFLLLAMSVVQFLQVGELAADIRQVNGSGGALLSGNIVAPAAPSNTPSAAPSAAPTMVGGC